MRNPVQLAHIFAEIMNSHDPDRFAELVSESYVNHNPDVAPGRAGLVAFMRHWFETLADTRVVVEDAFSVGDHVVGRYTYLGSPHGTLRGCPGFWRRHHNAFDRYLALRQRSICRALGRT
jgi:predicted SnoaL-like aldol condensation-catalyzing enzyme